MLTRTGRVPTVRVVHWYLGDCWRMSLVCLSSMAAAVWTVWMRGSAQVGCRPCGPCRASCSMSVSRSLGVVVVTEA